MTPKLLAEFLGTFLAGDVRLGDRAAGGRQVLGCIQFAFSSVSPGRHNNQPGSEEDVEMSRFQFRARLRVRALSLLAASVVAATVLTAAITPALLAEAIQTSASVSG